MTLASAISDAHRTGLPFPAGSWSAPGSFEEAEALQAEVARLLAAEVAGWKVGMAPGGTRPVSAPLFRHLLLKDGGVYPREQATFVAIEVEIGFHLLSDSEKGSEPALDAAFVGIEVVRSRYTEGPAAPFPSFLADNIANGAYVVGPEQARWQDLDLAQLRCRVWRDDELVHDAVGGHPQGHPLVPLQAHWGNPPVHLGGFKAGQIVTAGTLCGVMRIDGAARIRAELEGFGTVSVVIEQGLR